MVETGVGKSVMPKKKLRLNIISNNCSQRRPALGKVGVHGKARATPEQKRGMDSTACNRPDCVNARSGTNSTCHDNRLHSAKMDNLYADSLVELPKY